MLASLGFRHRHCPCHYRATPIGRHERSITDAGEELAALPRFVRTARCFTRINPAAEHVKKSPAVRVQALAVLGSSRVRLSTLIRSHHVHTELAAIVIEPVVVDAEKELTSRRASEPRHRYQLANGWPPWCRSADERARQNVGERRVGRFATGLRAKRCRDVVRIAAQLHLTRGIDVDHFALADGNSCRSSTPVSATPRSRSRSRARGSRRDD